MESAEYQRMAAVEEAHWWYRATRALLRQFLLPECLALETAASKRFLDAGCGTGATGAWLSKFGTVIALDTMPEALEIYGTRHPDAELTPGAIEAIPLPDQSVAGALCVTVLYHRNVADPNKAVRELARVVKPGGWVCLLEPGVRSLRRGHDRETHTARRFSLGELEVLTNQAGLNVCCATGAYAFLIPAAWLKSKIEGKQCVSDTAQHTTGLLGLFSFLAWIERQLLRVLQLPFGLSVLVIARKEG
jgi:SAM-dependent methyltransferase